jgi:hypothetical protein
LLGNMLRPTPTLDEAHTHTCNRRASFQGKVLFIPQR